MTGIGPTLAGGTGLEGALSGGGSGVAGGLDAIATGGVISDDGTYVYHTFTSSGTLGLSSGLLPVEYCVVAGGGGGGQDHGGGGGAGGMLTGSRVLGADQTVTVGDGGAGATLLAGTAGSNSSLGPTVATGGGRGHGFGNVGGNGGSGGGGGGGFAGNNHAGGTGTAGQGNNGGAGFGSGTTGLRSAGGGGGKGGVGGSGASNNAGDGGAGASWNGFGPFAGGGGGFAATATGPGGSGVGGDGGTNTIPPTAGAPNTGGGGGGAGPHNGGAGGSGIVIVRYDPTNWTNTGITSTIHWWDADDGVSTTTNLVDQVSGYNLSGSAISATTVNGRNAFQRGTASNCGYRNVGSPSQINGQSVWGCFWVGAAAQSGSGGVLVDTRTSATNAAHMHGVATGPLWAMFASTNRTYGAISNGVHAHYIEWNGASSRWIMDGNLLTPSGSIGTMSTGAGITILNTYNFGLGAPSGLTICEAKICIGTQEDAAISAELAALKAKWGTP